MQPEEEEDQTYLDQHEGNRNESYGDESQRAARPVDTQIRVHRVGEERESRTESGPHEVVAGEHGSCVFGVGIGKVVQDAVEQKERSNGEPRAADDWHDPVDVWARTPAEPE